MARTSITAYVTKSSTPPLFSSSRSMFKESDSDEYVWDGYHETMGSLRSRQALEELLCRHEQVLASLAWQYFTVSGPWNSFDDLMQHARVGAITAYNRFSKEKAEETGTALRSYVYATVNKYLLTAMDEDSFIHCPTKMRAMRSYLQGRYDNLPEKKAKFERDNGLDTPEKKQQVREAYRLLYTKVGWLNDVPVAAEDNGTTEVVGEHMFHTRALSEKELIDHLDMKAAKSKLSERQQRIYEKCLFEESTLQEAADSLNLTEGQVRGDLRTIRQKLKERESRVASQAKLVGC